MATWDDIIRARQQEEALGAALIQNSPLSAVKANNIRSATDLKKSLLDPNWKENQEKGEDYLEVIDGDTIRATNVATGEQRTVRANVEGYGLDTPETDARRYEGSPEARKKFEAHRKAYGKAYDLNWYQRNAPSWMPGAIDEQDLAEVGQLRANELRKRLTNPDGTPVRGNVKVTGSDPYYPSRVLGDIEINGQSLTKELALDRTQNFGIDAPSATRARIESLFQGNNLEDATQLNKSKNLYSQTLEGPARGLAGVIPNIAETVFGTVKVAGNILGTSNNPLNKLDADLGISTALHEWKESWKEAVSTGDGNYVRRKQEERNQLQGQLTQIKQENYMKMGMDPLIAKALASADTVAAVINNYAQDPIGSLSSALEMTVESVVPAMAVGRLRFATAATAMANSAGTTVAKVLADPKLVAKLHSKAGTAGITLMSAQAVAQNGSEVFRKVMATSEKDLMANSPEYRQLRESGKSHQEAQLTIASEAGSITAVLTGVMTAITGKLTGMGKFESNLLNRSVPVAATGLTANTVGQAFKGGVTSAAKQATGVMARESGEEGLQGGFERLIQNYQARRADDRISLDEGVAENVGSGIALGGLGIAPFSGAKAGIGATVQGIRNVRASEAIQKAEEALSNAYSTGTDMLRNSREAIAKGQAESQSRTNLGLASVNVPVAGNIVDTEVPAAQRNQAAIAGLVSKPEDTTEQLQDTFVKQTARFNELSSKDTFEPNSVRELLINANTTAELYQQRTAGSVTPEQQQNIDEFAKAWHGLSIKAQHYLADGNNIATFIGDLSSNKPAKVANAEYWLRNLQDWVAEAIENPDKQVNLFSLFSPENLKEVQKFVGDSLKSGPSQVLEHSREINATLLKQREGLKGEELRVFDEKINSNGTAKFPSVRDHLNKITNFLLNGDQQAASAQLDRYRKFYKSQVKKLNERVAENEATEKGKAKPHSDAAINRLQAETEFMKNVGIQMSDMIKASNNLGSLDLAIDFENDNDLDTAVTTKKETKSTVQNNQTNTQNLSVQVKPVTKNTNNESTQNTADKTQSTDSKPAESNQDKAQKSVEQKESVSVTEKPVETKKEATQSEDKKQVSQSETAKPDTQDNKKVANEGDAPTEVDGVSTKIDGEQLDAATPPTDTYEVSSAGDKRFSALVAKLPDGRTIEEAYQLDVKGYREQGSTDWRDGKGKPPVNGKTPDQLYQEYLDLWRQWAKANPELIAELRKLSEGKKLTDKFAKTPVNQARALTEILKELSNTSSTTSSEIEPVVESTDTEPTQPRTIKGFVDSLVGVPYNKAKFLIIAETSQSDEKREHLVSYVATHIDREGYKELYGYFVELEIAPPLEQPTELTTRGLRRAQLNLRKQYNEFIQKNWEIRVIDDLVSKLRADTFDIKNVLSLVKQLNTDLQSSMLTSLVQYNQNQNDEAKNKLISAFNASREGLSLAAKELKESIIQTEKDLGDKNDQERFSDLVSGKESQNTLDLGINDLDSEFNFKFRTKFDKKAGTKTTISAELVTDGIALSDVTAELTGLFKEVESTLNQLTESTGTEQEHQQTIKMLITANNVLDTLASRQKEADEAYAKLINAKGNQNFGLSGKYVKLTDIKVNRNSELIRELAQESEKAKQALKEAQKGVANSLTQLQERIEKITASTIMDGWSKRRHPLYAALMDLRSLFFQLPLDQRDDGTLSNDYIDLVKEADKTKNPGKLMGRVLALYSGANGITENPNVNRANSLVDLLSTSANKNLLSWVPNVASFLAMPQFAEYLSKHVFKKDYSDFQVEQLTAFGNKALEFREHVEKVVGDLFAQHEQKNIPRFNNLAKLTHKGKLSENMTTAMTLAVLDWMNNNGDTSINPTNADLVAYLKSNDVSTGGISEDSDFWRVSETGQKMLKGLGRPYGNTVDNLGNAILRYAGLKETDEANAIEFAHLKNQLAQTALGAAVSMGLVEITGIQQSLLDVLVKQTNDPLSDAELIVALNEAQSPKDKTKLRIVRGIRMSASEADNGSKVATEAAFNAVKLLSGNKEMLEELLGVPFKSDNISDVPITEVETGVRETLSTVSEKMRAGMEILQKTQYFPHQPTIQLISNLDQTAFKEALGYVSNLEDVHITQRESQKGVNISITKDYNNLLEFSLKYTSAFLPQFAAGNMRVFEDTTLFSPQKSKMHRNAFYLDEWKNTLVGGERNDAYNVMLAQALGIKVEQKTTAEINAALEQKLTGESGKKIDAAIELINSGSELTAEQTTQVMQVAENMHGLRGLIEEAQRRKAQAEGKDYSSHFYLEIDGKTNGTIHAAVQYGQSVDDVRVMANRGGLMFKDQPESSVAEWAKNPDSWDIYQTSAKLANASINEFVTGDLQEEHIWNSSNLWGTRTNKKAFEKLVVDTKAKQALFRLAPQIVDSNQQVTSEGRNIFKPGTMTSSYMKSLGKIAADFVQTIQEGFYNKLTDINKNYKETGDLDQAIDAFNAELENIETATGLKINNKPKLNKDNVSKSIMEYRLPANVQKELRNRLTVMYGVPAYHAFKVVNGPIDYNRKQMVVAADLMQKVFKELFEAKSFELFGTDVPNQKQSKDVLMALQKEQLIPNIHFGGSNKDDKTQVIQLANFVDKAIPGVNPTEMQFPGESISVITIDSNGNESVNKQKTLSAAIFSEVPSDSAGVRVSPNLTHSQDSFNMMLNIVELGGGVFHAWDAVFGNPAIASKLGEVANRNFIEVHKQFKYMEAMNNALQPFVGAVTKSMSGEGYADPQVIQQAVANWVIRNKTSIADSLNTISELIEESVKAGEAMDVFKEYIQKFNLDAIANKEHVDNLINQLSHIDQFTYAEGVYQLADKTIEAIKPTTQSTVVDQSVNTTPDIEVPVAGGDIEFAINEVNEKSKTPGLLSELEKTINLKMVQYFNEQIKDTDERKSVTIMSYHVAKLFKSPNPLEGFLEWKAKFKALEQVFPDIWRSQFIVLSKEISSPRIEDSYIKLPINAYLNSDLDMAASSFLEDWFHETVHMATLLSQYQVTEPEQKAISDFVQALDEIKASEKLTPQAAQTLETAVNNIRNAKYDYSQINAQILEVLAYGLTSPTIRAALQGQTAPVINRAGQVVTTKEGTKTEPAVDFLVRLAARMGGRESDFANKSIESIRKALGSSAHELNNALFAHEQKILMTSENIEDIFDRLTTLEQGPVDAEHADHLRRLVKEILVPGLRTASSLFYKLATDPNSNINIGDIDGDTVRIQAAGAWNTAVDDMSLQEVMTHEVLHGVLRDGLDHNFAANKEAERLFNIAKKGLSWKDFMPADPLDTALAEKMAKARWDYIFNNPQGNQLHEFVALGLSNQNVRQALAKLDQDPDKPIVKGGFLKSLRRLFEWVLDALSARSVRAESGTVDEALMNLAKEILTMQESHRHKVSSMEKKITKANAKAAEQIAKWVTEPIGKWAHKQSLNFKVTQNPVKNGINRIKTPFVLAGNLFNPHFTESFNDMTKRDKWRRQGMIKNLMDEFGAPGPNRIRWTELFHKSRAVVDQKRDQIMTSVSSMIMNSFEDGRHFKDKDWEALSAAMIQADVSALTSRYSSEDIFSFMDNTQARKAEITKLSKELSNLGSMGVAYTNLAKGLANHIVTGLVPLHAGNSLMKNANNIVQQYWLPADKRAVPDNAQEITQLVDQLVSLATLDYMNPQVLSRASKLIAKELERGSENGFNQTMAMHNTFKRESLETSFGGDPISMEKGYISNQYDEHVSMEIAPTDPATRKEMRKRGFKLDHELPIDKSAAIFTDRFGDRHSAPVMGVYVAPRGTTEYMKASVSLTNPTVRGTALETVVGASMPPKSGVQFYSAVANARKALTKSAYTNSNHLFTPNLNMQIVGADMMMIPVLDMHGEMQNFRYEVSEETKVRLLKRKNLMHETLGRMFAAVHDKQATKEINEEMGNAIIEDWNKASKEERDRDFMMITASSKDERIAEQARLIPYALRVQLNKRFANPQHEKKTGWETNPNIPFPVRIAEKQLILGDRKFSITNLGLIKKNPDLVRWAGIAEDLLTELVQIAKLKMAVLNIQVLGANIWSNFMIHKVEGVPLNFVAKKSKEALVGLRDYQKNLKAMYELDMEIRAHGGTPQQKAKLMFLQKQLDNNPVAPLIDKNMFSAIVEEIDLDAVPSRRKLISRALQKVSKDYIPKQIRTVGYEALVMPGSKAFNAVVNATRYSDFVSRYIKYEYDLKILKVPKDKVITDVRNTFIDYDLPSAPALALLNDYGLLMFFKYASRIVHVALNHTKKRPLSVVGAVAANAIAADALGLTSLDSIYSYLNVPEKVWNNLHLNPFHIIDEVFTPVPVMWKNQVFGN